MSYKMLCIDIDGTLLNSNQEIGERTQKAIRTVIDQGYLVTLVTGRRYLSAVRYAHQLRLDLPLICFNGGLVVDTKTNKAFHRVTLPRDYAHRVIEAWSKYPVPVFAYQHSMSPPDVYHQNLCDHHRIQAYLAEEGPNVVTVQSLLEAVDWDPLRIMTYGYRAPTEQCYYEFQDLYREDGIQVLLTENDNASYLEILPSQATKANGLRWLCEYFQITRHQIIAFGDNLNDLDMLEWAGLGVAMGNALPEVKAVSDMVTGTRDEDGIAQALKDILGLAV